MTTECCKTLFKMFNDKSKTFFNNETTNKKGSSKSGMPINDEGICAACEYSFKKNKNIDWQLREESF